MIEVKNLTVSYDRKPVLWDIDLAIPKGLCVGIIGPNGAGKTTLVQTMIGLMKPLSGEVFFKGVRPEKMVGNIAYVPQRKTVDWDFPITVFEVVLMGLYGELGLFRRPGKKEKKKAMAVLERLGMSEFADRHIGDLSGGQQQRLFVARALLQEADVYFFDEPFVCIDKTTEGLIVELFKELIAVGKSVFVVHHDLNTVRSYFDWIVMLNTRLIASGSVQDHFNLDNLQRTFGYSGQLFEEVLNLTSKTQEGLI